MASNARSYYSLPTQPPQHNRSSSRRPPLTPSTVSSPCISTTQAPVVARRDSSGSPTRASALLAKVASHPSTPRGETPIPSPIPSPGARSNGMETNPLYSPERPAVWRSESDRYVQQYRKQDGYISFPDFEKFCESQNPYDGQRHECTTVKT
ncbi:hypothetical protein BU24DRAFT_260719 [Aaosphaeria arxii CBS 175.79]|uniref:Uncharacterized protein n=1 Tax=Aaosphaeria arxii CBS 175.79 TaxID=1450172 RepID=A0A6A5XJF3_9PLEO|nr:uncharacterized protein BU24DRAFT_260719 [Aaosphaeria arxii CBS 175.79]KAF2012880.1 hypothetical protein BU24DRAFT_260719 [Aaosphaeria arxii CBS 175.79]